MTAEDPGAAYVGTCDAGNCDAVTSAVVWTEKSGWLSVCRAHAVAELRFTPLPLDLSHPLDYP